jgi:hypothetical protein
VNSYLTYIESLVIRMDELLKAAGMARTEIMGETHSKNIRAALLVAWDKPTRVQRMPRSPLFFIVAGQLVIYLYCI